jgi:hypothetical protein
MKGNQGIGGKSLLIWVTKTQAYNWIEVGSPTERRIKE